MNYKVVSVVDKNRQAHLPSHVYLFSSLHPGGNEFVTETPNYLLDLLRHDSILEGFVSCLKSFLGMLVLLGGIVGEKFDGFAD